MSQREPTLQDLVRAIKSKDMSVVASVLGRRGSSSTITTETDSAGWSCVHHAASPGALGCDDILRLLLGARPAPRLDARSRGGRTALQYAALYARLDAVRMLLAAGASPNAADNSGCTALHLAARRAPGMVLAALVAAGADLAARNSRGETAEQVAQRQSNRSALLCLQRESRQRARCQFAQTAGVSMEAVQRPELQSPSGQVAIARGGNDGPSCTAERAVGAEAGVRSKLATQVERAVVEMIAAAGAADQREATKLAMRIAEQHPPHVLQLAMKHIRAREDLQQAAAHAEERLGNVAVPPEPKTQRKCQAKVGVA